MPGLYTHTTRATGTILTAAIYNADHQNHIDNQTLQGTDDYSTNQAQMRVQTDPGDSGSEVLATSLAGEIERLRFAIAEVKGSTYWYDPPAASGAGNITTTFLVSGDITPTQITADTDDWAPTSLATNTVIRFSTDASRKIKGLTGGSDGRIIILRNVGSFNGEFVDESGTSTAANRFALKRNAIVGPGETMVIQWDATLSRWTELAVPFGTQNPSDVRASGFTVDLTHKNRMIACNGTFTVALTAVATLGDGFWFIVSNEGAGVVTIDPNAAELVNEATTLAVSAGQSILVWSKSDRWRALLGMPSGGAGEANTTSNSGSGSGWALAKSGVNLPFKSVITTKSGTRPGSDYAIADLTFSITVNANDLTLVITPTWFQVALPGVGIT